MKQMFLLIFFLFLSAAYGQQVYPVVQNPRPLLDPTNGPRHQTPTAVANPVANNLSALILQYNDAIRILEIGLCDNWRLERYIAVFDEVPALDSANAQLENSRRLVWRLVREMLTPLQQPRTIWDERTPTNVEILNNLERLRSQRDLLLQFETLQKAFAIN